jgi:rRNA pseudouridine-1189 N-methylase Emg1 (Nep1/Mra1 family)
MKANNIVNALIHLPRNFNNFDTVSFYNLLKDTGYFDMHKQVCEENLQDALLRDQECINEWLTYSEDKRSSSGWYFKQENANVFIVGFINSKGDKSKQVKYADRIKACAAFIKHEIEEMRKN